MVCKIRIWGDWVPTMRWQVNGEQVGDNNTKTHHDNISVSSAITLVINSNIFSQSIIQVSCLTHFTLGNKPKSKSASNIPDYHHTWVAPPLMIKKGQSLKLRCGSKLGGFFIFNDNGACLVPKGNFGCSLSISHQCSQEVEVGRKIHALLLKQALDLCKLRTSAVWGEVPAANDFGAFFLWK